MNRVVILKDKRAVRIRPIAADDVERSLAFFRTLAEEERRYLRRDVTRRETIEERIQETLADQADRIVAVCEDRIVAEASLARKEPRWEGGAGEIRIIVAPEFRRCGLGRRMLRELYVLAHKRGLGCINVRVIPEPGGRAVFRRMGFDEEAGDSESQDLILMRCDLAALMEPAEDETPPIQPPSPMNDVMVTEVEVLRRYALRWAILAAWNDDLDARGIVIPENPSRRLEEARVLIASGCFGSCYIGSILGDIEAHLVSADASAPRSKANEWIDLLGRSMTHPEAALAVGAVKFRYMDWVGAGDGCGVKA